MSLSTFIKLTKKAFRFAVARPIQRFNIYNRSHKYLGPEAKYFAPAPRAIGALSQNNSKPLKYPHLEHGYKSVNQRRIEALKKGGNDTAPAAELSSGPQEQEKLPAKAFSETINEDSLVIKASNQLEVTKTIVKIKPAPAQKANVDETAEAVAIDDSRKKTHRPLPKCTNLPLQDLASIWVVDKTPPGRLNLNQLQEIMINKLGDDKYWTPKAVADKYNIKEEYAESLMKYMKQIRIVVSPGMAKFLDYAGMNDPHYQAAKHLVYHVDNSLRSDLDKKYDEMFLPNEELDDDVKKVLDKPESSIEPLRKQQRRLIKRPEPLRLSPLNKPKEIESRRQTLQGEDSSTRPKEKISIDANYKQS